MAQHNEEIGTREDLCMHRLSVSETASEVYNAIKKYCNERVK